MSMRIREAMREDGGFDFGEGGGVVEVDETFIGREPGKEVKGGYQHKLKVLSLVDRESGQARNFVVDKLSKAELMPILKDNISREANLMTDEAKHYSGSGQVFASHEFVSHKRKEYVRGNVHTNTIEGYFSIFKRGMKGVYQHCGKQHLHRYLAEYAFRYNNRAALEVDDKKRAATALLGVVGKRITYERA